MPLPAPDIAFPTFCMDLPALWNSLECAFNAFPAFPRGAVSLSVSDRITSIVFAVSRHLLCVKHFCDFFPFPVSLFRLIMHECPEYQLFPIPGIRVCGRKYAMIAKKEVH